MEYAQMQTTKIVRTGLVALVVTAAGIMTGSAQAATGTANASAVILTPISITKNTDLSFGDVYPDSAASGTVTVDAAGARTTGGAATLGATPGAAAQFTVSGQASAAYTITLPAAAVTLTSGANSMTIDTFATDGTGNLDGTGNEVINVGATLNVSAGQAAGTYSGTFDVTVNYN
jgi:hypothetical protein